MNPMRCCVCKATMDTLKVIYRVNEKGDPGRFACGKHFNEAVATYRKKKDTAHADDSRQ